MKGHGTYCHVQGSALQDSAGFFWLVDATFYYVHNPLTNEIISLPIFKWQREEINVFPWENLLDYLNLFMGSYVIIMYCKP